MKVAVTNYRMDGLIQGGSSRFPFGYSSRYRDAETAMLYYGYRYLDTGMGRWPNPDPIRERGGLNLYGFVGNEGVNQVDVLGLDPATEWATILGALSLILQHEMHRCSQQDWPITVVGIEMCQSCCRGVANASKATAVGSFSAGLVSCCTNFTSKAAAASCAAGLLYLLNISYEATDGFESECWIKCELGDRS